MDEDSRGVGSDEESSKPAHTKAEESSDSDTGPNELEPKTKTKSLSASAKRRTAQGWSSDESGHD